ncbi:MAG TPA: hypothetical protein VM869_32690 [Enhygromyxa sp.]|nr:hypothetical protein [Enhygromyxa sp.]
MPTVFSANHSSLLVDGDPVEGVQSLAFRVVTEREDIRAIGSDERVDVSFGLRTVAGEVVVRSTATVFDGKLATRSSFNMVAALKKGQGADDPSRSYAFDDCYVETKSFAMSASGTAETTYVFTATRVREE